MTLGRQEDYEVPVETTYDNIIQKIQMKIFELQNEKPYGYGNDYWIEFLEDLIKT